MEAQQKVEARGGGGTREDQGQGFVEKQGR